MLKKPTNLGGMFENNVYSSPYFGISREPFSSKTERTFFLPYSIQIESNPDVPLGVIIFISGTKIIYLYTDLYFMDMINGAD